VDRLAEVDLLTLQSGTTGDGNVAVIAAGTGLGFSALVGAGGAAVSLASERGHADVALRSEFEGIRRAGVHRAGSHERRQRHLRRAVDLFLCGRIAARLLGPTSEASQAWQGRARSLFLEGFLEKGRLRPLFGTVPVRVNLDERAPLIGAARCAATTRAARLGLFDPPDERLGGKPVRGPGPSPSPTARCPWCTT
jgi:glucokinase